ncbi:MAG: DUF5666 domain-containing protein [Pseudomonadota bacterium]
MTERLTRRFMLTSAVALAACAPLQVADNDRSDDDPRGGIGGTGIVGTLTDFGSLMVNGERIVLTEATSITGPFGALTEGDLAIGQALTIEASPVNGVMTAARVVVSDPLTGLVQRVDRGAGVIEVLGVEVRLDPSIAPPPEGARVAVSGLWRGDAVEASRIALTSGSTLSAIMGVARSGEQFTIGGVPIRFAAGVTPPPSGAFVTASGLFDGVNLIVTDLAIGRFTGAAGPIEGLSIEGYLDPIASAPFFEVSGLGHSFDAAAQLGALKDERSVMTGPYTGAFEVAEGLTLRGDFEDRRALLRRPEGAERTPTR